MLLARLAGGFQAPLVKAAGLFSAFTRNFAYGIKAYVDQRVAGGETMPEPEAGSRARPRRAERPTEPSPGRSRSDQEKHHRVREHERRASVRGRGIPGRSERGRRDGELTMATMSTTDLLDVFKNMTVLELNDFLKAFEEEFGVTAAAPGRGRGRWWRAVAAARLPPRSRTSSTSSSSPRATRRSRSSRRSGRSRASG